MAILPILVAPHPVLKKKCTPVEAVDGHIRRVLDDMLETMYDAPGIGLAAPQIGLAKRMLVVDCAGRGETPQPMKIINPEIIAESDELASYEEGCLSFPEQYADVKRPARVTVKYLDETGTEQTLDADGLLATCIQHEIDHLDGVVFVDHISSLKRGMIMRKLQKLMRGKPRPDVAAE
ncbi:MAG TPA: peptide deformylase [Rhodospirillaceae bacterium]|nr:peptide deformylase [Rhodospirillaceae bacterium]MAX63977.1 peptide deformylase [Rhodospirillaceae bacterium]MBB58911.1 peptide deformylase [Rhodospirillaceae bacterium]HBM11699.1 peptide deformylase [Rhodospirillaceae bacterium]